MTDWTEQMPCVGGIAEQTLQLIPKAHGVVSIIDHTGGVVALGASADMRSWSADRLGPAAEGAKDLRSASAQVRWVRCGSLFESDLMFLGAAAELDPLLHRTVQRKLAVWWIGIDPMADAPRWSYTDEPERIGAGVVHLGPFSDRASAKGHAEWLDDRFELCRFPDELARAPRGKPCLYKDMNRCPAACDGSEPIAEYRGRLRRALGFRRADISVLQDRLVDEMQQASQAQDFDRAARVKQTLETLDAMDSPALEALRGLDEHAWAAVTRSERSRTARVLALAHGRWQRVGDIEVLTGGGAGFGELAAEARRVIDGLANGPGVGDVGVLGVLGRALMKPSRSGLVFVHRDEISGSSLLLAAERVTRINRSGKGSRGKGS